jgi:hypothetical protein
VDDFRVRQPGAVAGDGERAWATTGIAVPMLDDLNWMISVEAGIKAQLRLLRDIEARIGKLDAKALNAKSSARISRSCTTPFEATRLDVEEVQSYRHNPTVYVELIGNALYTPYVLLYAASGGALQAHHSSA